MSKLKLIAPLFLVASTLFGSSGEHSSEIPMFMIVPFVIMLLSIAILPLIANHWWEHNKNKLIIALALGLPTGAYLIFAGHTHKMLDVMIFEYVPFIILLGSLFVISGGILVAGDIKATPKNNTIFLAIGGVLASFIGTTGAAMLLIRPFINTNKERTRVVHSVVFFIFIVCNMGGLLTPLGDPPLFLGYLKGVPFTWTFKLAPEWAFMVGVLLVIYYIWDTIQYKKEPPEAIYADNTQIDPIKISGKINFVWLIGIVLSVAFINGNVLTFLPTIPDPYVSGDYIAFIREAVMIAFVILSIYTTKKGLRAENKFTLEPIKEVAYLFIGIFLTMIPSLMILANNTEKIKEFMKSPAYYFWGSGILSSFLDNAPTYVTFFTAAGIDPKNFTPESTLTLIAISLGAVFMGAMTYIGNGPNFMVKAIAEENKIKMPSFFGYMKYSIAVLIPLFVIVTFLFL